MRSLKTGDIVQATYKSGEYIGELTEMREARRRGIVKILAVLKHPRQGDLHHPMNSDVPLFHQRRALANGEHASVPLASIRPYDGHIPDYHSSLLEAVRKDIAKLQNMNTEWAKRSLEALTQLKNEYEENRHGNH